ncbi:MAG: hypothetical protein JWP91_3294 [Fibrobacteres bacterium]|nr:hypothetical protein [Fibrobacterota bacterium]
MQDPGSEFFGFEADFVDSLRCIPMAVRMRLDITGVKLKLNEWSKLSRDQRLELASKPCGTETEIEAYREAVSRMAEESSGARPSMLPELPETVWENADLVPEQVLEQAHALGMELPLAAWASLHPLQRFALVKLSRPGHENRNFPPAMREFGLTD